ncbi:MAG: hypothetical protein U1E91_04700 [Moraxella sp.]
MNILVIGTGGREHALAWQCAKDSKLARFCLPTAMQAQRLNTNYKMSI